ncbi:xanthine dehydrogenase accessory protein XdhC [Congregibacter litoralis]|uniref:Molybdenum cofactor sulfurylase n=1 Tax=Congregibacter litoralis KT71 TaxID=314285 RepID=A4A377_9GAMM|nr:xanthine dehydrogenase accessory protein XdhC [Congregibacter litoralis]EAQ99150.1 molybdenum cofactor sulfurylase [Congregibacter litoralis KT71]
MSMRADGHWSEGVRECESLGHPYVIVTMLGVRGSTPRDAGTKMVVSTHEFCGTIGGGELEFRALHRARNLLGDGIAGQWVENFPLGEKLGQCCGGSTSLLFEHFVPAFQPLYLFGAGHVGRALAPVLAPLPLKMRWVDARTHEFPDTLPTGVEALHPEEPVDVVKTAPPGSYFLIMTHQHPLDYALMEAALQREDAAYIGVIGSDSKWRRFKLRLEHRGFPSDVISTIHCPIGLSKVPGKRPAEIAVSVAAEVIAHYHARQAEVTGNPGPGWKQLQAQLKASQSSLATSDVIAGTAPDPDSSPRGELSPRPADTHSTKVK